MRITMNVVFHMSYDRVSHECCSDQVCVCACDTRYVWCSVRVMYGYGVHGTVCDIWTLVWLHA